MHKRAELDDIPDPAVALIADFFLKELRAKKELACAPFSGELEQVSVDPRNWEEEEEDSTGISSLMALNQRCLCVVLSVLKQLRVPLRTGDGAHLQIVRRFLDKARTFTRPGFTLTVGSDWDASRAAEEEHIPGYLLVGATAMSNSWKTVNTLILQGFDDPPMMTIPTTFPNITTLKLRGIEIKDPYCFEDLSACTKLTNVEMDWVFLEEDKGGYLLTSLAELPSIEHLRIQFKGPDTDNYLYIPACNHPLGSLLNLKTLTLGSLHGSWDGILAFAARLTNLTSLSLAKGQPQYPSCLPLPPAPLENLLTSCTSLTSLSLPRSRVCSQALEVLLTHGSSITSLSVGKFRLDHSHLHRPCHWKQLQHMRPAFRPSTLASLPLHSLTQPLDLVMDAPLKTLDDLPDLVVGLAGAVRNIRMYWQQRQMPGKLTLLMTPSQPAQPSPFLCCLDSLTPLAPFLADLNVKSSVDNPTPLSSLALRLLGHAHGRTLFSLGFEGFFFCPWFFQEVYAALPRLNRLRLVNMQFTDDPRVSWGPFCKAVARPLEVVVDEVLWRAFSVVQGGGAAWDMRSQEQQQQNSQVRTDAAVVEVSEDGEGVEGMEVGAAGDQVVPVGTKLAITPFITLIKG